MCLFSSRLYYHSRTVTIAQQLMTLKIPPERHRKSTNDSKFTLTCVSGVFGDGTRTNGAIFRFRTRARCSRNRNGAAPPRPSEWPTGPRPAVAAPRATDPPTRPAGTGVSCARGDRRRRRRPSTTSGSDAGASCATTCPTGPTARSRCPTTSCSGVCVWSRGQGKRQQNVSRYTHIVSNKAAVKSRVNEAVNEGKTEHTVSRRRDLSVRGKNRRMSSIAYVGAVLRTFGATITHSRSRFVRNDNFKRVTYNKW